MKLFSSITRLLTITLILVMISSCKVTQDAKEELVTIDAKKAYNKPARDIMLSELVEDIEYVKLETSPDCFIGRVWGYTASEHYVVLHDSATQRVLLFTTDGKYLNDIGSRGQGPGEYSFVDCWTMKISPDEKHILLRLAWYSGIFNMYNIDGSFIKKCIIPPVRGREFGYFGTDNFVSIKQSSDLSKTGGNKLLIFDKEINLTDSLMLSYDDANMVTGKGFLNNRLYIYKGNIYLQQKSNDTIFRIDQTYSIKPHLVIDFGGLKIPSPIVPGWPVEFEYYQPYLFNTINNYDFINLRGSSYGNFPRIYDKFLVYNRISGEAFFLDVRLDPYLKDNQPLLSIINDMDGVKNPQILYSALDDKRIDPLHIIDAKPYLESGAVNPKKLVTDKYYNELSKLLAESDIEDNPIIRIMHFK